MGARGCMLQSLLRSTLAGRVASCSVHVRATTEGRMQPWHRCAASPALGVPSPPTSHSCGYPFTEMCRSRSVKATVTLGGLLNSQAVT